MLFCSEKYNVVSKVTGHTTETNSLPQHYAFLITYNLYGNVLMV